MSDSNPYQNKPSLSTIKYFLKVPEIFADKLQTMIHCGINCIMFSLQDVQVKAIKCMHLIEQVLIMLLFLQF